MGSSKGLRRSDRRKAYSRAGALAESDVAIELLIRAAELEAERIVRDYRRVIDTVASIFCAARIIRGSQFLNIINRMS